MMPVPTYNFDGHDADVILRTPLQQGSDKSKDFRVHKVILSIASTLFHDMFSLPQPTAGDATLPVVPVTESAEVFEIFLRFIYPVEPPTITSLQLVDDLFQLAEKYMANSVHAKLRQILMSSPAFLNDDPIWVYALACRTNLDTMAELAIPFTFKIDPIRDIPQTHLRMMTAETYNRLLMAHSARRPALISAVSRVDHMPYPGECRCGGGFYTGLENSIKLAIWEQPFLDRQRLDSCLPKSTVSKCGLQSCRVSELAISKYLTGVLDEIGKLG